MTVLAGWRAGVLFANQIGKLVKLTMILSFSSRLRSMKAGGACDDFVGGFIYIALVKVTPQLLENCDPVQTLKEVGAM